MYVCMYVCMYYKMIHGPYNIKLATEVGVRNFSAARRASSSATSPSQQLLLHN